MCEGEGWGNEGLCVKEKKDGEMKEKEDGRMGE